MASAEIKDLFDSSRFPKGPAIIPFIIYLPIGVALAIIRLFIGLHAFIVSSLLPKMSTIRRMVLRGMCMVLGIVVTQDGDKEEGQMKVMVANYTSLLDHLAVELALPNVVPNVWGFSPSLSWLLGYVNMGANEGKESLLRNARKHLNKSSTPLLAFPEGSTTNGNVGLLKFSSWPFSLDQKIQPILINITRPFIANLPVSVLGGSWLVDILWFLIVPYTSFHIRFCPLHSKSESETTEEFALRLQKYIASQKSIKATIFTYADKKDYMKKKAYISSFSDGSRVQATSSTAHIQDTPLNRMTRQVKDVLPHVPSNVIFTDLEVTNDVDITISNILEGKVKFTPEDENNPQPVITQVDRPTPAPTSAKSFGRNSGARHLSLDERKQNLLENARRKYMEKHMKK